MQKPPGRAPRRASVAGAADVLQYMIVGQGEELAICPPGPAGPAQVAISPGATARSACALAIGQSACAHERSPGAIAVGAGAQAQAHSRTPPDVHELQMERSALAVGAAAFSGGSGCVAVGPVATATDTGAVALGAATVAEASHAVALGAGSRASEPYVVAVGNKESIRRRVAYVEDARDLNDAVNLKQLLESQQLLQEQLQALQAHYVRLADQLERLKR